MTILLTTTAVAILLLCLSGNLLFSQLKAKKQKESAMAILLLPYSLFSVLLLTFVTVKETFI